MALFVYFLLFLCKISLIICLKNPWKFRSTFCRSFSTSLSASTTGQYLGRLVERKKIVVDGMLRRHQDASDPLVMRMSYMATEGKFNVTRSLKLPGAGREDLHTMSVMIDMKRKSPTIPTKREIVDFKDASQFAELLTLAQADAFLINTDEQEYGGNFNDLKPCVKVAKNTRPENPPACIVKDIILHPIQIAQAVEQGATGVLLITAVVGGDLETLLNSCTIMGVEAIVEVHTPSELDFALARGATIFLVNMWDRMSGILHPQQAKGLASMMPMNAVAIAAGNIRTVEQACELGFYGYDSVVLGRNLAEVPDIQQFIDGVHGYRGAPRKVGMGMKGLYWG